jgi:ABC-type transport system involved in multi-copper enzyme maturation permease subunit
MFGLIRAEWLKVTRQGTTKTLVGLLAVVSGLVILGVSLSVTGTGLAPTRQAAYSQLNFPNGILTGMQIIDNIGIFIVTVFFASTLGSEYGLDTWKNLLIRRQGRGRFLLAKLMVVSLALLGTFVMAVALTQLLALVGQAFVSDSATQAGLRLATTTSDQFLHSLWVNGAPLLLTLGIAGAIASAVTILGRSTVAGILLTLVWYVGDGLLSRLIPSLGDYTANKNISSLGQYLDKGSSGAIPAWQSLIVVGAYFFIPLMVAIVTFQRRDMAGN